MAFKSCHCEERSNLVLIIEEIAALHCIPLAMTFVCGKLYIFCLMSKDFPSIPRFITEHLFSKRTFFYLKYVFVGAVSGALLIILALQSVELKGNMLQADQVVQDREQLLQEVVYWKQIADTYSGYRDIYYRIATLQYKLGNTQESKKYLQKALELDPNFEEARVLGAKIEASHR